MPRAVPEPAPPAPLDPERLLTTLAQHGVRFVLVGALAARLHGFPRVTARLRAFPANARLRASSVPLMPLVLGARSEMTAS